MHPSVMISKEPKAYAPVPTSLRGTAAAAVLACGYLVGTGGDPSVAYFQRRQEQGYRFIRLEDVTTTEVVMRSYVRSAKESIDRIREILKFSISELAAACNVSRQAVYKWMSGDSASLEEANQNRLDDLYRAAEMFVTRGISGSAMLLKRRNNKGQTLIETMRNGDSAQTWANDVLHILELETQQRAMLEARLRARKRPAPAAEDWGTPVMNENDI
jgi:transcriptional regulator with XRE-family HTH domain